VSDDVPIPNRCERLHAEEKSPKKKSPGCGRRLSLQCFRSEEEIASGENHVHREISNGEHSQETRPRCGKRPVVNA